MCELGADIAKANNGAQGSARQFKEEFIMVYDKGICPVVNVDGILALKKTIKDQKLEDIVIVFSALSDKDVCEMKALLIEYPLIQVSFDDERLNSDDINYKDILNKLSIYSREYFSNNDMFNDKVVFDMMIDGTKSIKDNYKYFNITSDGLIIYFNRYQIAPYYYGDYSITIPYNYLDLSI